MSSPRVLVALALAAAAICCLPSSNALSVGGEGEQDSRVGKVSLRLAREGVMNLKGGLFKKRGSKEYEFDAEDEAAFKTAGSLMRGISRGFFLHSLFEAMLYSREALNGNGQPWMVLECLDELAYANLIRSAASCMDDIIHTQGNDIKHLMTSVEMQNKMWQKMRVPLYIKTTLLFAELIKNVFGKSIWDSMRKTAIVGYAQRLSRPILREAERRSRPIVRVLREVGERAGELASEIGMIASAMARAADQKIATVTGRLTDTGIVCDRLMDGSIIVGHLTRMPVIKSIQSMKNGFDPVGIQVGDVILSVGDSFCSKKLAHAIDSELLGPMGTSVKVRLNRPPTPGVPGTGGQFYATIVRQV